MTPRVKQFRLVREDDGEFDFRPGQHTQLHFDQDGEEVVRPYTPTTVGETSVTLAIKRYDDGTASVYMHERERGDTVRIEEPDGNLHLRDTDRDVAFVSTGTGITPMMAMLKQYLREGSGEAAFLFGEKSQEDIMYRETLDQVAAEYERLTVLYSLSEEEWDGPTGHVQTHLDRVADGEQRQWYVCGVPGMVVETKEALADRGIPDEQVYSEGWEDDEVTDEE